MPANQDSLYQYRVDADDRIVWVDTWWLAFAKENGAGELTEQAVVGTSLWDHISGDVTQLLYQQIHARLRRGGEAVILPFRCDSASVVRQMRLTITPEPHGHLRYESMVVRVTPRPTLDLMSLNRPRSVAQVMMCSCCLRGLHDRDGWLEAKDISIRLRLFDADEVPRLTYTICPKCEDDLREAAGNGTAA